MIRLEHGLVCVSVIVIIYLSASQSHQSYHHLVKVWDVKSFLIVVTQRVNDAMPAASKMGFGHVWCKARGAAWLAGCPDLFPQDTLWEVCLGGSCCFSVLCLFRRWQGKVSVRTKWSAFLGDHAVCPELNVSLYWNIQATFIFNEHVHYVIEGE